jgi:hypothetical protein
MTVGELKYSKEEFARRGNEIYETQVRPQVEEGNHGKIVAIDIETGAFELAKDTMTASNYSNATQMPKSGAFGLGIKAFTVLG